MDVSALEEINATFFEILEYPVGIEGRPECVILDITADYRFLSRTVFYLSKRIGGQTCLEIHVCSWLCISQFREANRKWLGWVCKIQILRFKVERRLIRSGSNFQLRSS